MLRIGRMIRSAKMNATTPPKLIPPFHNTAARGTLPIEHTKLTTATIGPTSGPPDTGQHRVVGEEEALPEAHRYPRGDGAGDQQSGDDVAPDRGPLHHEGVRDRGEPPRRGQPPPERTYPTRSPRPGPSPSR